MAVRAAGDKDALHAHRRRSGLVGQRHRRTRSSTRAPTRRRRWKLTLTYGHVKETFNGGNVGDVRAGARRLDARDGRRRLERRPRLRHRRPGAERSPAGSTSRRLVGRTSRTGSRLLEDQPVNILLVAGVGANVARGVVAAHLERTENEGRERIAILGAAVPGTPTRRIRGARRRAGDRRRPHRARRARACSSTDAAQRPADRRCRRRTSRRVVAGRLSTLAPHVSLTNQTLPIDGLDVALLGDRVQEPAAEPRAARAPEASASRSCKGITTDPGAFRPDQRAAHRRLRQGRRAARARTRTSGELNNARVRAALKATLDGFLSQMVLDEMLIGYELDVSATRRAGDPRASARSTMTLQPTFSIDFIRVTMNLAVERRSRRCPTRHVFTGLDGAIRSPSRAGARATPPRPSTTPTR